MRNVIGFMLMLILAACQMSLPFGGDAKGGGDGKGGDDRAAPMAAAGVTAQPGAITGGAVTAQALPAPGAKPQNAAAAIAAPKPVAAAKPGMGQGAPIPAGTIKGQSPPAGSPGTAAAAAPAKAESVTEAPAPETAPEPPPKPAAQLVCEGDGGVWVNISGKGVQTCAQRTRDGGKSCKRERDCEGLCLARSRTCAPIQPLFGCNEILQADGRQVTLCID